MIKTAKKHKDNNEVRTVNVIRNTWILEMPDEICDFEGMTRGTLVSLTIKDHGIQASFIRPPSAKLQDISKKLKSKNHELYEELKRLGD
ncbi:MAG: hypothetical protein HOP17_01545 [Acidobacteria bacterium]|nr:hypothetical protein [Acidobacteriota bacterium]